MSQGAINSSGGRPFAVYISYRTQVYTCFRFLFFFVVFFNWTVFNTGLIKMSGCCGKTCVSCGAHDDFCVIQNQEVSKEDLKHLLPLGQLSLVGMALHQPQLAMLLCTSCVLTRPNKNKSEDVLEFPGVLRFVKAYCINTRIQDIANLLPPFNCQMV